MDSYQNIFFEVPSVSVAAKISLGLSTLVVALVIFLVAPRVVLNSVADVSSCVTSVSLTGKKHFEPKELICVSDEGHPINHLSYSHDG